MTGTGGGQNGGGVGRDRVIGKGRRKGGYQIVTGAAAGARAFTVGAAAADDECRGNTVVVMKCGANGNALLVCWHCLEKVPECFRCPSQGLRFEYIDHFALCGLCPSFCIQLQWWWASQMSRTCLGAPMSIAADVSKPNMGQCFPKLGGGTI